MDKIYENPMITVLILILLILSILSKSALNGLGTYAKNVT
jgi:hypothetical protein